MRIRVGELNPEADRWLPEAEPDGSQVGINHADAYVKPLNTTLEDGTEVRCTRRGLQLTAVVGEGRGEALLRRIEHGPEVVDMLRAALEEAFSGAGAQLSVEDGAFFLEIGD